MPPKHTFTARMQKVVEHYVNDPTRNKVAAYRAGYDCSRMTVHVVSVRAAELFKHPIVSQVTAQLHDEFKRAAKVDALWVLEKLQMLAEFNIARFIVTQDDGTAVYDFSNATEDDWYCISEYSTDIVQRRAENGVYEVEKIKLKPHCRLKAIELIGKLTGVKAFSENVDINALVGVSELDVEQFKTARRDMLADDDC